MKKIIMLIMLSILISGCAGRRVVIGDSNALKLCGYIPDSKCYAVGGQDTRVMLANIEKKEIPPGDTIILFTCVADVVFNRGVKHAMTYLKKTLDKYDNIVCIIPAESSKHPQVGLLRAEMLKLIPLYPNVTFIDAKEAELKDDTFHYTEEGCKAIIRLIKGAGK